MQISDYNAATDLLRRIESKKRQISETERTLAAGVRPGSSAEREVTERKNAFQVELNALQSGFDAI